MCEKHAKLTQYWTESKGQRVNLEKDKAAMACNSSQFAVISLLKIKTLQTANRF